MQGLWSFVHVAANHFHFNHSLFMFILKTTNQSILSFIQSTFNEYHVSGREPGSRAIMTKTEPNSQRNHVSGREGAKEGGTCKGLHTMWPALCLEFGRTGSVQSGRVTESSISISQEHRNWPKAVCRGQKVRGSQPCWDEALPQPSQGVWEEAQRPSTGAFGHERQ